jgi:hypothetical protein
MIDVKGARPTFSLAAIGDLAPAYYFDRPNPWGYVGLAVVAATVLAARQRGGRLVNTADTAGITSLRPGTR